MSEQLKSFPDSTTGSADIIIPLPLSAPLPAGDELSFHPTTQSFPARAFIFPIPETVQAIAA